MERPVIPLSQENIDLSEIPDRPKLGLEDRVFAMNVLEEAIEAMADQEKLCLLPMLGGYTPEEIAERLRLPQATVEALLEGAFAKIRAIARGRKESE
jgi:DNA-directed RNA polymerase specialized sigma24 family protein